MDKTEDCTALEKETISLGHQSEDDLEQVDLQTLKEKTKYNPEYNLRKRTLVTRLKTEKKRSLPKEPKPKTSPAPLSKYRRKTANARERERMQDINSAFIALQKVIPNIEQGKGNKMTKVTTLRLAMNYISALRQTLGYDDFSSSSPLSPSSCEFSSSTSSSSNCDLGLSNCCLSSPVSASSDLNSDGDSVRSSSVSSADEAAFSPIDGDILQAEFSTEEFDLMCSDVSDTITEMCP